MVIKSYPRVINEVIKNRLLKAAVDKGKVNSLEGLSEKLGKTKTYLSSSFNKDRIISLTIVYDCAKIIECEVPPLIPFTEEVDMYIKSLYGDVDMVN